MNGNSPRILFMCSALGTGGAERQWSILLPRLVDLGLEPRVITLVGRGAFFEEIRNAGIPADCAEMRSRYDLWRAWQAIARMTEKPDLIVTQETNAHVVGHAVASRAHVGHIAVDHTPQGLPRSLHRRLLTRFVAKRVDAAVGVSRSQIPDLIKQGYPESRLRVIYNGVPALKPTKDAGATRASLGIADHEFLALMVAALRPQKRAPFFIDAVVAANRSDSRIKGIIVGGGPDLGHVCALAKKTEDVVQAVGERSDIANLMHAADVVCLTSWTEGLPMVLLEAMALSCTILATNVAGTDEVIIHKETGILGPAYDALEFGAWLPWIARDRGRAKALGEAAKTQYEREFTAERMALEYAELFNSVRSTSRSGRL